ncbi:MAG: metal-sensing transcriptional repressor [Alphaproteobacteria bacterium]
MKSKKVDCCDKKLHPDHSKELSRLNRVSGQIEGVKRMICDCGDDPCSNRPSGRRRL